jgi:predicted permease
VPSWLTAIGLDIRHALRGIARTPAIAVVVIVSVAAGIGVNTVVFSWIQARVLRPLPGVPGAGSYHLVEARTGGGFYPGLAWPEFDDIRGVAAFDGLIAFRSSPFYIGETGSVERVSGMLVSDNYFEALGLTPAAGRFPAPAEAARARAEPIAVISYGLWQSRFEGTPSLGGLTLRINGREIPVVGVAPRGFQGTALGLAFEVFIPVDAASTVLAGSREREDRSRRTVQAIGRLRRGVTIEQAQAQLDALMAQLATAHPYTNRDIAGEVLPIRRSPRGPQRTVTALYVLQATMFLLLGTVCGNMANLLLARASSRQREVGVRLALGAQPWRIRSLLLCESLILAAAGAALGAAIAVWGTRALLVMPTSGLSIRFQTDLDTTALFLAMVLGVMCGLMFGGVPAVRMARVDPQSALRNGSQDGARSRLRRVLLAVQAALATAILIVGGLFVYSFLDARATDTGFEREGVLLASYDLRGRGTQEARLVAFAERVITELQRLPDVESAAIASSVPLDIHGLPLRMFTAEGRARDDGLPDQAYTNTVTPRYFETMGIPMVAGRDFSSLTDPSAPPQAIVNEAFARQFLADVEPLGRRIQARGRAFVVVGVVRNSLSNAFGEPPTPVLYLSYRDNPQPLGDIHLRARTGPADNLASAVRRSMASLDPELPIFNVRTLDRHVETNLIFRRIPARMFMVLGPLLLILSAIGIYAAVAYTATLRAREIGVRLALGAGRRSVVWRFVADNLQVIVVGVAIGCLVAVAGVRMFAPPRTPSLLVFLTVPAVLLVVSVTSCWWPAYRVVRSDPMRSLRQGN